MELSKNTSKIATLRASDCPNLELLGDLRHRVQKFVVSNLWPNPRKLNPIISDRIMPIYNREGLAGAGFSWRDRQNRISQKLFLLPHWE